MKAHRVLLAAAVAALAVACDNSQTPTAPSLAKSTETRAIGINVVLNRPVTDAHLAALGAYGNVVDVLREINAVVMVGKADKLPAIRALAYVKDASGDAERTVAPLNVAEDAGLLDADGAPIDLVSAASLVGGRNTWDLDLINVTNFGVAGGRVPPFSGADGFTGAGVYVGVLDTGLLDSWRAYFPQERIASQFATGFTGGGAFASGTAAEQPNKWEHDQNSHGTHVTSTILGYSRFQCCDAAGNLVNTSRNGVAPMATVIPVKVLNQSGSGWSSAVAQGIMYIASLVQPGAPLAGKAMVINMSLGGGTLDAIEKAAVDYATTHGVVVVVAAGNSGERGMSYPGAYAPVISVGSIGWRNEWATTTCPAGSVAASWWTCDVLEPTTANDVYVSSFSGRQKAGQELDVMAPGSWVVGPYQLNSGTGKLSYFFLGGTSMATPHVAGIAALMLQKNPSLTNAAVESILKESAIAIPESPAAGVGVRQPNGATVMETWKDDASGKGFVTATAALSATP